jgi:hypothetical protein
MKILIVLLLLLLGIRESSGCISAPSLRGVIRKANRVGRNFPERPIQSPIYLNISDDEATSKLLQGKPSFLMMPRQGNVTSTNQTAPAKTTNSTSPFDDPLFVPGDFLDSEGKAKFASEIPIEDLMSKFVRITTDDISNYAWKIVLLLLLQIGIIVAFIILSAKVLSAMFLYKKAKAPLKKLDQPKVREVEKKEETKEEKEEEKHGMKRKPIRMKQGTDPRHR